MPVTISVDYKATMRALDDIKRRQVPYAVASAMNETAWTARTEIQGQMPSLFTIRKQWVVRGVRIERAKKSDLARYGFSTAYVKHIDEHMAKQEHGGTIKPKRRYHAIPARKIRGTKTQSITKSKRPAALLKKPGHFIDETSKGPALFKRIGKKRIRTLYLLRKQARYRPRFGFEETVERVVRRDYRKNFGRALARAIATAR